MAKPMCNRIVLFTEGERGPTCGLDADIISHAGGSLRCVAAADEADRIREAQSAEVLVAGTTPMTRNFLSALPRLKAVVRAGIGVDTVDMAAATALGIVVANVPDFCRDEVAEHTLALIFAVARKIALADSEVRRGRWEGLVAGQILPIYRLNGKTIGLIGLGKIGQAVAQKAQGLGMKVIGYDKYISSASEQGLTGSRLSLGELLSQADIISLHVPLTPETRHLINASTLKMMKPQAILINTSRGAVVDEVALRTALEANQLAGAGLDVLEEEPPRDDHLLFQLKNVVFTCHYASCSIEAYATLRCQVSEQVAEILRGSFPKNLANPQVKNQPNCRLRIGREIQR
jgi:D-3-phosphoglycerate dehydrogenase / 2-oxoglutarate reductase